MSESRDAILVKYLRVCSDAAEVPSYFDVFKSHPDYKEVLEHLKPALGELHLKKIITENPNLLIKFPAFWENDKYGSPELHNFGNFTASPTTIQYISVLSSLIKKFESLDGMIIVEIGGGYGGQAKIILDHSLVKAYNILDLDECSKLQEVYLDKFGYNSDGDVETLSVGLYKQKAYNFESLDLVMSNYAISEISDEDQLDYVKNICLKAKHGYLTCNQPLNGVELLQQIPTFKIEKDIEGEREENYLITW